MSAKRQTLSSYDLLRLSRDPGMHSILGRIETGSKSRSVILYGETGTGKEVIAKALYECGPRNNNGFVILDCANQNRDIMGSELFGHERGAFTGANMQHIGSFERANKGTLFLDEIGELPSELQARLLRVLETQSFNRVGGREVIQSDFNLIAATNKNLEDMVKQGTFRQDLFYRLNVFRINIPPLRNRPKDVVVLASYFADQLSNGEKTLDGEAEMLLSRYNWPGNVRELRNVIEQAILLSNGDDVIKPCDVSTNSTQSNAIEATHKLSDEFAGKRDRSEVYELMLKFVDSAIEHGFNGDISELTERLSLEATLKITNGNCAKASKILGISSITVSKKAHKFELIPKK